MKLRICQIIPTLVQGGAEKQMTLLAAHLDKDEFESHVIVLTHSGPLEEELRRAGVQVHLIGKRSKADPGALLNLIKTVRAIDPHVVHTWLFAGNSYGRLAAKIARVPVIIAGERCVDQWKSPVHFWMDRWLIKGSHCIATNSSGVVDFYERHGLSRDCFRVIPNAIGNAANAISRDEFFRRLGLPPSRFVIGAVGRLWPQKGYSDLIWASELLRVAVADSGIDAEDVWLVIIGDGPERGHLQKLRDRYGATGVVRFVGHRSDAAELMTALDVLWNGSHYEGQSNTIMEAMSVGVPVVATDVPGNSDLVVHQQTGYLYPLGDVGQLARVTYNLLQDQSLRTRLGQNARQRILENFSLNSMVMAYSQLYREMWDRHPTQ